MRRHDAAGAGTAEILSPPDLLGRSALPLLTSVTRGARTLFLFSASTALVTLAPGDRAQFREVRISAPDCLPFLPATFDCVVVDGDLAGRGDSDGRTPLLAEVERLLKADGECVLTARQSRIPANPLQWRGYTLRPSDRTWSKALQRSLLTQADEIPLEF